MRSAAASGLPPPPPPSRRPVPAVAGLLRVASCDVDASNGPLGGLIPDADADKGRGFDRAVAPRALAVGAGYIARIV